MTTDVFFFIGASYKCLYFWEKAFVWCSIYFHHGYWIPRESQTEKEFVVSVPS